MAHGGNYVANQEFLNFGSDVAVALNPANVTPTTSYNNSVGDDKIFFSNGINYLEIVGGKDIVETGKGINVLDIKSVNYLNLNLYDKFNWININWPPQVKVYIGSPEIE